MQIQVQLPSGANKKPESGCATVPIKFWRNRSNFLKEEPSFFRATVKVRLLVESHFSGGVSLKVSLGELANPGDEYYKIWKELSFEEWLPEEIFNGFSFPVSSLFGYDPNSLNELLADLIENHLDFKLDVRAFEKSEKPDPEEITILFSCSSKSAFGHSKSTSSTWDKAIKTSWKELEEFLIQE